MLAVVTQPAFFPAEAEYLEGLLEAGLEKLHLRKPRAEKKEVEAVLERLAPRWADRLVVHGGTELAVKYGVRQVHGAVGLRNGHGGCAGGVYVGAFLE